MKKRHITKVIYRFSDGTVEMSDTVSVVNLNYTWLTAAFAKLKNCWVNHNG